MLLSPGARVGPYQILALLGAGGMGEVYRARDSRLERTVALKVSAVQFGERFEREARAMAALNHPHICQLYDIGPDYLVMEYIEGEPLRGPLRVDKAVQLAIQLVDALQAAHLIGIVHRDLKPANILVSKSGIKLLDFGLAAVANEAFSSSESLTRLTAENQIVCTLLYMSPEQLQGRALDARSDLFSFGLVLYEVLTGKRAFEADSQTGLIA